MNIIVVKNVANKNKVKITERGLRMQLTKIKGKA